MNLEELSAIIHAERTQEAPPLPALQQQPPLTGRAGSYLNQLKAHAPSNQPGAIGPGPMTGHGRITAALYNSTRQGSSYLENMQMPPMPHGGLHGIQGPISSAFDSQAVPDMDMQSEAAEDQPRF